MVNRSDRHNSFVEHPNVVYGFQKFQLCVAAYVQSLPNEHGLGMDTPPLMCFTQGVKDAMCGGKFVDRVIVVHGDVSKKATFE